MSETGYTDEGFVRKDITDILKEKENESVDIFDNVNKTISDPLWQWMKIVCYERVEQEIMHELASQQMTLQTAVGTFLDKHGIEAGIERKGATKSEGYVDVTVNIQGSNFLIPAGTRFTSGVNNYISDEDTIAPYSLTMTKDKTGVSQDYFPTDIAEVSEIEQIILGDGTVVNPYYYQLDPTYKNNIIWIADSSSFLIEDEEYIVRFTGNLVQRVEVSSEYEGPDTVALEGKVTTCVDYPSLICTNSEAIEGGADEEMDDNYRSRILGAKRRTFTLGRVKDIILGLDSVRATKVYQNMGVDQSSVEDWDNPTLGSAIKITGQDPIYSQAFVPGDNVLTLGRITLYGLPVNRPPALIVGIKRDVDEYETGVYKDYFKLFRSEVDPTVTGYRDLKFELKFNGLDKTKTYRFDVWCDNPGVTGYDWANNYWEINISSEMYGTGIRYAFLKREEETWIEQAENKDIMFKTHWKGAGFTAIVSTNDGYGFDNTKLEIEELLDYVEDGGYSPICIQPVIEEAEEITIDVRGTVYITALADFANVRREIEENIEAYLESLGVGENIVYARIHQEIMRHEQVNNLTDLEIKRSDVGDFDELDLAIQDTEIADLGTTSFNQG